MASIGVGPDCQTADDSGWQVIPEDSTLHHEHLTQHYSECAATAVKYHTAEAVDDGQAGSASEDAGNAAAEFGHIVVAREAVDENEVVLEVVGSHVEEGKETVLVFGRSFVPRSEEHTSELQSRA